MCSGWRERSSAAPRLPTATRWPSTPVGWGPCSSDFPDGAVVVTPEGGRDVDAPGRLVVFDPTLDHWYVAREGASEVIALASDGARLWSTQVDGATTAVTYAGAIGAAVVSVDRGDTGAVVYLDGRNGDSLDEVETPAGTPRIHLQRGRLDARGHPRRRGALLLCRVLGPMFSGTLGAHERPPDRCIAPDRGCESGPGPSHRGGEPSRSGARGPHEGLGSDGVHRRRGG